METEAEGEQTGNQTEGTQTGNQAEGTQTRYPSGELMLAVIQKEYDYEAARKTALENRSGILITLAAAILTFAVSNIKEIEIKYPVEGFGILFYYFSCFILLVLSIGGISYSLYHLLRVLFIDEYKRLDVVSFNRENAQYTSDIFAMACIEKYNLVITHNHVKNDVKVDFYKKGIKYLIISLFATILLYGLTKFM